jgi:glutamyl-tRNA(Gln) amidotransferase subunit E
LREDEPLLRVRRKLRPTQSELGEVDRAALAEAIKGKSFSYQAYPDTTCLVELDGEPPHPLNKEALDIALQIALRLGAEPVDEVHVMRKVVIDGSNTTGFQRTALVATGGGAELDGKKFGIQTVCLEEDAARKVRESKEVIEYRLDRLGIPLVEIATAPDFSDPETPARAALYLGQVMRAMGRVKRGLGTIRQDINISISGGARQEIKGVQELGLIQTVIEREVQRQLRLLEIRDELRRRGAKKLQVNFSEVTSLFRETSSKVIRQEIEKGDEVLAVRLSNFAGLLGKELQPGRRFGTELSDHARTYGKVGGIFHTDELPAYGISEQEVVKLREVVGAGKEDAVVMAAGPEENVRKALEAVVVRANQAVEGVPEETRRALPDGNTEFTRPLPGAGRMYIETDTPPIPIPGKRIAKLKKSLPELPQEREKRLTREFKLGPELAKRMALSENLELFGKLVSKCNVNPILAASTLEGTMKGLKREGFQVEKIREKQLEEIFTLVSKEELAKEVIPGVLKEVCKGISVKDAFKKIGARAIPREELVELIHRILDKNKKLIKERKEAALKPLMGIVMAEVRGKADGKLVHELLKREMEKIKSSHRN